MDSEELDLWYLNDIERLHGIIKAILISGYKYNAEKKEFVVKFKYTKLKDIEILINLTSQEKDIISKNTDIRKIIEQLHKEFLNKNDNYSNTGKLLEHLKTLSFLNKIEVNLKNNFELFHEYNKYLLVKILADSFECCIDLVESKEMSIKLNDKNDIHNYSKILENTLKNAFTTMQLNLSIDCLEFREYKNIWNNILYIWTNSLTKKRPNNTLSAIENLLQFNELENGELKNLNISIQVGYKYYLKNSNDYRKTIVKVLVNTFATNDIFYTNKDKFESIRQLCTSTFKDEKIMDNRTFKKYIKPYEIILSQDFRINTPKI
ncbi:MAG: hypothetical protein U9R39_02060 [Campylobacterota bacterium]|nr:hypothetical protein [Campylobacterota bacterium]